MCDKEKRESFFLPKKDRQVGGGGSDRRYTGFDLFSTKVGSDMPRTPAIMFFFHIDTLPSAEKPQMKEAPESKIGLFGRGGFRGMYTANLLLILMRKK